MILLFKLELKFKMKKIVYAKYVYMLTSQSKKIKCKKTKKAKANNKMKMSNKINKRKKKLHLVKIYTRRLLKKQK